MHTDKVVVLVTPEILKHKEMPIWVARFPRLGLSAYGPSQDEAMQTLRRMLKQFIGDIRESGHLAIRLDRAGVKWFPADQYDKPYEDLTVEGSAPFSRTFNEPAPRSRVSPTPTPTSRASWQVEVGELQLAA